VNKPVKKDEFSDILNSHGFKATPESGPSTMNSLRQQPEEEDDPVKAKVKLTTIFDLKSTISLSD
jgi:hypothetical protein